MLKQVLLQVVDVSRTVCTYISDPKIKKNPNAV